MWLDLPPNRETQVSFGTAVTRPWCPCWSVGWLCRGLAQNLGTQGCFFSASHGLTEPDAQAPPLHHPGHGPSSQHPQRRASQGGSRAYPGFADTTGFKCQTSLSLRLPPVEWGWSSLITCAWLVVMSA